MQKHTMASDDRGLSPARRFQDPPTFQLPSYSTRLPQRKTNTSSASKSSIPTSMPLRSLQKEQIGGEIRPVIPSLSASNLTQRIATVVAEERPSTLPRKSTLVPSALSQTTGVKARRPGGLASGVRTAERGSVIIPEVSSERAKAKPQRNVLRRKPSTIGQRSGDRTGSTTSHTSSSPSLPTADSLSMPDGYRDPFPGSVFGITFPRVSASKPLPEHKSTAYREQPGRGSLEQLPYGLPHKISTQNLPPPTPIYTGHTSSSSTRYSESPGPFSRTSTPTSMSSHSPGIVLAPKSAQRIRQPSPIRSRPPVTRTRAGSTPRTDTISPLDAQGLPSVRESLTSSSSGSTVKAGDRSEKKGKEAKKVGLSPPPPSPPPRKSSTKFSRSRSASNDSQIGPSYVANVSRQMPPSVLSPSMAKASRSEISVSRATPPLRPSRVGAPELDIIRKPSPVIRSNLSRLETTGHKRRESLETPSSTISPRKGPAPTVNSTTGHSQDQPGVGLRLIQKSPSSTSNQSLAYQKHIIGSRPSLDQTGSRETPRRGVSPAGAGATRSASRFGIFSRRPKLDQSEPDADNFEKSSRRGPVAGTGHEGYNKYALRGRSGSITSNSGSWARSASAGSTSGSGARTASSRKSSITSRGEPELDEFFLDRLAPVVIGGGGEILENRNVGAEGSRRGSIQSSLGGRPSLESRISTSLAAKASSEIQRPAYGVPVFSRGPSENSSHSRSKYLATDGSNPAQRQPPVPTLAARRSLHKSQLFNKRDPVKIPTPIATSMSPASPLIDSHDTSQYFIPHTESTHSRIPDISEGKEGNWLKSRVAGKQIKSPSRWNFFQRAQIASHNRSSNEIPATVATHATARPVAHYAMLDSAEELSSPSLDELLPDVTEVSDTALDMLGTHQNSENTSLQRAGSLLLPSPPTFPRGFSRDGRPSSPKVLLRRDEGNTPQHQQIVKDGNAGIKPSRLPQVGRIPRVISTRDRNRKLPIQSFSRPFVKPSTEASSFPSLYSTKAHLGSSFEGPTVEGPDDLCPNHHSARMEGNGAYGPSPSATKGGNADDQLETNEFFSFPHRMVSDASYSSSSGIMSFAAATAMIAAPDVAPGEDEIWNDYDELIDDVLSPQIPRTPLSATSSHGAPFQYANFVNPTPAEEIFQVETPIGLSPGAKADVKRTSSVPPTLSFSADVSDLRSPQRSSRLFSAFRSSAMPSTPSSFTEFFAGYGERNNSDPAYSRTSAHSRRISSWSADSKPVSTVYSSKAPEKSHSRDTQLLGYTERGRDANLGSSANLRFGALMTSRWLSFGRVLFSPAHLEVKQNRHDRVLILDGLGNDDWSFYCALTYPSATIYNLSPHQSLPGNPSARRESGAWSSPSNHRQIHHASIAAPFPFPKGFFAAVVFRFPVVSSDAAYRNAISESKRVLRPGGYLEMSVLDLDMMNMGNRARRAVRMLKVRMQVADPELSLKPASDNIQRMLGRRGFENLNRCMVGVPAGGSVRNMTDSKSSSVDEGQGLSLTDMLKDDSQGGDEGITKCVAKVGRWWYTRCYEMGITVGGDTDLNESIWSDPALIKECERRGTSFRLLVCYAQKPLVNRRRTVSV
ncbi:MAG: hypothetical protein M1812_000055 [Candelaria pacifica]|nr:MAG: hypothetical protein M1812_000055 [Candelaria pacifica]